MHAHTRDCPLSCLEPLLMAQTYRALQAVCPTIGHVVDLYRKEEITSIRRIGARGACQIETCLASAGLTEHPPEHDAAHVPDLPAPISLVAAPPPLPAGWSGARLPGMPTRLFTE
jgi:hypothetical protein